MYRHHIRRVGLLLVAGLCAALASCVPVKEPLSDAMKSEPDKDLIGTWVREHGDGMRVMMIGRHELLSDPGCKLRPRGVMCYEQLTVRRDGRLSRDLSGAFFVSHIKAESYANILAAAAVEEALRKGWEYPKDNGCLLVRYRIEKDTLTLFQPDEDKVKAAVNKGAIKGTMQGGDVEMDGGTALAEYLGKEGGKSLFPEEGAEKWQRAKIVPVK